MVEAIQHDLLLANRDDGVFPLEEPGVKDLLGTSPCKSYPVLVPPGQIVRLVTMPHARHEENGITGSDPECSPTGFDRPGTLRDVDNLILRQPAPVLPVKVMRGGMLNWRIRRERRDDALTARRHVQPPPPHSTVDAKITGINVRVGRQARGPGHFVQYVGQYMQ